MGEIVDFTSKEHFIRKLQEYTDDLELFFEEYEKAAPLMQKYFKYADDDLKIRIIMQLGGFAKEWSCDFCYQIAMDMDEEGFVRETAALQLGHILKYTSGNEHIWQSLLADLKCEEKRRREYVIRALGFEGNLRAALPLVELLFDKDEDIQQSAIVSLSSIRDPSVVTIIKNQLENASPEKVMTILSSLLHFREQKKEIESVYQRCVMDTNPQIRLYALALLGQISNMDEQVEFYASLIGDDDRRIRKLVAEYLGRSSQREKVRPLLLRMLEDSDVDVKRAALSALKN